MALRPILANSKNAVTLLIIELLVIVVLFLACIVLAAGTSGRLQEYSLLTFDISLLKSRLANSSYVVKHALPDWYEPHYLSICHGTYLRSSTYSKNASSTVCISQPGGYNFSLPELLAARFDLSMSSSILSQYSFAQISTKTSFICLVLAVVSTAIAGVAFFITLVTNRNVDLKLPLLWPRIGFLASLCAVHTMLISAADITAKMRQVLDRSYVEDNGSMSGAAYADGALYALSWVAFGLLFIVMALEVVLIVRVTRTLNGCVKSAKPNDGEVSRTGKEGFVWMNEITES